MLSMGIGFSVSEVVSWIFASVGSRIFFLGSLFFKLFLMCFEVSKYFKRLLKGLCLKKKKLSVKGQKFKK